MRTRASVALAVCLYLAQGAPALAGIHVIQGGILGTIQPYAGGLTGNANYNYFSASAHPIIGPAPLDTDGQVWLYSGTDGLNLNMVFGREGSGTPFPSQFVQWDIAITGATNPGVRRSDDRGELIESPANMFRGRWRFGNNTDGGVIGALDGLWRADFTPLLYNIGQRQTLHVYSGDGTSIPLDPTRPFALAQVPEPGSIAIWSVMGLGAALVWYRRRRVPRSPRIQTL